jgi:hypothetical protein
MRELPLHYERPLAIQVVLAHLVPLAFGVVCGLVLGVSETAYTALTVIAAIGAFLAGLEHQGPLDGASRGVAGGALFGVGILVAHALTGAEAKLSLPHPEILLAVVTTVAGAALGAGGAALRARLERRATRRRAPRPRPS